MSRRAALLPVALLSAVLLLAAACTSDESGGGGGVAVATAPDAASTAAAATSTPPPAPSQTATPPAVGTATPIPLPPRPPPSVDAVFCDAAEPIDGRTGSIREGDERDQRCNNLGFVTVLSAEQDAAIAAGDFVADCLQRAGEGGFVVSVGVLCVSRNPTSITTDPLPSELRGVIADGDVLPSCQIAGRPDWEITTGPPCVLLGYGILSALNGSATLEGLADCSAGLTFMSDLEQRYRRLAAGLTDLLASEDGQAYERAREELRAVRDEIAGLQPAERASHSFETWGDLSPIFIRGRDLEALGALLDAPSADGLASPASAEASALQDDVAAALHWFSLGRGCGG